MSTATLVTLTMLIVLGIVGVLGIIVLVIYDFAHTPKEEQVAPDDLEYLG